MRRWPRPPSSRDRTVGTRTAVLVVLALAAAGPGCAGGGGSDAGRPGGDADLAIDGTADAAPDAIGDARDARDAAPDGATDTAPGEATSPETFDAAIDFLRDPGSGEPDEGTDAAADPAPADLPPDGPPDPGPACDPDAGPCPCTSGADCPAGMYCDGADCRPWACDPDARFCQGTLLLQCARDGGGFIVLQQCDDGDPCTLGDGCAGTDCLPLTRVDCDDGNPCTDDRCDPASGLCASTPSDAACDDGDPCTAGDHCQDGACAAGGAANCDDLNPCTSDYCTSLLGCVHEPVGGPCHPVSFDGCSIGGECRDGACASLPPDCDDGDPCTTDGCLSGACFHTPVPGCACQVPAQCEDADSCTLDECVDGRCVHEVAPLTDCCTTDADCDGSDPCTIARCESPRCRYVPAPDAACCTSPRLDARFDDGMTDGFGLDAPSAGDVGWRLATPPGGSGGALYFGDPTGSTYGTGARVAGTALSALVTIPAGVTVTLAFRTWQDVESVPGQDPFTVDAVSPQGLATPIWVRPEGFPMRTWQAVSVDVTALGGHDVRIRFGFDTLDGVANDGQGVYVDDVALASFCTPPACQAESDCTSLGFHAACTAGACDYGAVLRVLATLGGAASAVKFSGPSDVAVSPDGRHVYVSDRDAYRIQVFDGDGHALASFGNYGTTPGRLILPRGLAAADDRVYVADTGNHRIQAFTPAGTLIWALGGKGSTPGKFIDPKGLALSDDGGTIWVADTSNHRVQGITPWGVVRVVFGTYGKAAGQFRSPSCVVPLADGGVAVCDTQNNRIETFTGDGVFRSALAPLDGVALSQPYGAARTGDGGIWVADTYGHRLVLMDATGRVRDRYGSYGSGTGQFAYPLGMESDAAGHLWVVDNGNLRVLELGRGPVP